MFNLIIDFLFYLPFKDPSSDRFSNQGEGEWKNIDLEQTSVDRQVQARVSFDLHLNVYYYCEYLFMVFSIVLEDFKL